MWASSHHAGAVWTTYREQGQAVANFCCCRLVTVGVVCARGWPAYAAVRIELTLAARSAIQARLSSPRRAPRGPGQPLVQATDQPRLSMAGGRLPHRGTRQQLRRQHPARRHHRRRPSPLAHAFKQVPPAVRRQRKHGSSDRGVLLLNRLSNRSLIDQS